MLSGDEDDEHEDHKDVGVDAQEIELHLVVDHLHAVVGVKVLLVLYVVEDQCGQDEQEYDGSVEAEEGGQRPELEQHNQLELYRETRVLDLTMK